MELSRTKDVKYDFIFSEKYLSLGNIYTIYSKESDGFKLSAYMSAPAKTLMKFKENSDEYPIPDVDGRSLKLATGVYPFEITPFPTVDAGMPKDSHLSGAMVVFNLDNTVELASFGKSLETKLFKPEMIEKALNGALTEGIVSFDDKPRILYWFGNRKNMFFGGNSTAEVDFSKNPGISELKINGNKVEDFIGQVDIFNMVKNGNTINKVKRENEFYLKFSNGKAFKGYIRNIEENATTAFVRIPCTIPQNLLDAAVNGTISKLKIHSDGPQKETIAEVVFGFTQ
jgi:hypothetical protein